MGGKISLSILCIVAILVVSGVISIAEFHRMNNYVSDRMQADIDVINRSTTMAITLDEYNLRILALVGDADNRTTSDLDPKPYLDLTDSLLKTFVSDRIPMADSLGAAYSRYKEVSLQLDSIIVSDFTDTRDWFFLTLQPEYDALRGWQTEMHRYFHNRLQTESSSFDDSLYRSLTPGIVSISAAIALCLLLLFFILVFYVRPLSRMLRGMDNYRRFSNPYTNVFDGNDQLQDLNNGIADLIDENISLKRRLHDCER